VAIATPAGRGGLGVVRIAGPDAKKIAASMLRLKRGLEPGRAVFGELVEPCGAGTSAREQPRLDEVVVSYFAKPHSYTTDDVIEISGHGSPVILERIVQLGLAAGARLADPGEFTMRAFLNGRIDLSQAEAVRDLIESQTLYQAKVAAQQLGGSLSKTLQPVKAKLVELIALLEAGIDFAEDEVPVLPGERIGQLISEISSPLKELARSFDYGQIVHQGLTLAIVGRPNVGKSSLFNRLVERERAIVTAAPGTTRDLVTETVSIGGIPVKLVDTAGIRRALDEAESIGIQKSKEALADSGLALVVIDASQAVGAEDRELLAQVEGRSAIVVLNKSDLATNHSELEGVRTSAITGQGIPELRAAILKTIGGGEHESAMLTNVRHQKLVQDALAALAAAVKAVESNTPHEMVLLDLYSALHALDEITGATTNDDILNVIFGKFCIGK